jgi:predicted signal transduction protein with EAL and GGDEF domain
VAEGVEDQRTWDRLRQLGCDRAQGYFLSRPISPREFQDWLEERSHPTGAGPAGGPPTNRPTDEAPPERPRPNLAPL